MLKLSIPDAFYDAANLLEDGGWTTGYYAIDVNGRPTAVCSENATCWCASGAIVRVLETNVLDTGLNKYHLAFIEANGIVGPIQVWNDNPDRKQHEVVAAFRHAADYWAIDEETEKVN